MKGQSDKGELGMSDASGGRSAHVEGPDERENYKLVLNP